MSDTLTLSLLVGLLYAHIQIKLTKGTPQEPEFFTSFCRGFTLFYLITALSTTFGEHLKAFQETVPQLTGVVVVLYAILEGKRKRNEGKPTKDTGGLDQFTPYDP